jgi:hypothetical protein
VKRKFHLFSEWIRCVNHRTPSLSFTQESTIMKRSLPQILVGGLLWSYGSTAWAALSCDDVMDMVSNKMPNDAIGNMMKRSGVAEDSATCL